MSTLLDNQKIAMDEGMTVSVAQLQSPHNSEENVKDDVAKLNVSSNGYKYSFITQPCFSVGVHRIIQSA